MIANSKTDIDVALSDGTVVGAPRRLLRLEGAALLAGSLIAYTTTHQAWWLVPLTLLLPDLFAVGYLGVTRLGAHFYNLVHITPLPAVVVALGWRQHTPPAIALSAWSGSPTSSWTGSWATA
jgi:hypothetical protein